MSWSRYDQGRGGFTPRTRREELAETPPRAWASTIILGLVLFAAGYGAAKGHRWTYLIICCYVLFGLIGAYVSSNTVKEDP